MEIRILKYFVAVAKQCSFSRAADSLFISQPSLSKQIALFEQQLGVQLFTRGHRSISLTPAGQFLLIGAEDLLRKSEALEMQVKQLGQTLPERHRLTLSLEEPVTANTDVCQQIVVALQDLKRQFASLETTFFYESHFDRDSMLTKNADIFLRVSAQIPQSPNFHGVLLSEDQFVLVAARSLLRQFKKPSAIDLLQNYPLLMLSSDGHGILDLCSILADIGSKPNIIFSANDYTLMLDLATESGIAIVPQKKAREMEKNDICSLPLPSQKASVSLFALYEKKNPNPLIPVFLNNLTKRL